MVNAHSVRPSILGERRESHREASRARRKYDRGKTTASQNWRRSKPATAPRMKALTIPAGANGRHVGKVLCFFRVEAFANP
jgi:hypothetical protein